MRQCDIIGHFILAMKVLVNLSISENLQESATSRKHFQKSVSFIVVHVFFKEIAQCFLSPQHLLLLFLQPPQLSFLQQP